jgi:hypothetical protein
MQRCNEKGIKILGTQNDGNSPPERPRIDGKIMLKQIVEKYGCKGVDWI